MEQPPKWQSLPFDKLHLAQWDDDAIMYNPLSGETHQLNLMAVDALSFLQTPATLPTLTEHICHLYQTDDSATISEQMTALIKQFDEIGLISACPT
jgi:PqqD family protein of HPr-rel-A system